MRAVDLVVTDRQTDRRKLSNKFLSSRLCSLVYAIYLKKRAPRSDGSLKSLSIFKVIDQNQLKLRKTELKKQVLVTKSCPKPDFV